MRVLSVPQLASGTVDLVRGHPLLTDRKPIWLKYAGHQDVRLDNVELRGHEEGDGNGENHSAQWFAQVTPFLAMEAWMTRHQLYSRGLLSISDALFAICIARKGMKRNAKHTFQVACLLASSNACACRRFQAVTYLCLDCQYSACSRVHGCTCLAAYDIKQTL